MDRTMLERLEATAPYNIFYNVLPESEETFQKINSIHFKDLLCPSLGQLKCSLHISFMVHISWLMRQYEVQNFGTKPLTLLYEIGFVEDTDDYIEENFPNLIREYVEVPSCHSKAPGCHHSKISVFVYEDNSLRVVVSTANLYEKEWDYANQQLWVSPSCCELPEDAPDSSGESPTNFKASLLDYLESYNLETVKPWLNYVKRADFSNVKVFFIMTVPGKRCHLETVGELLPLYCSLPENEASSWPIIAQMSSVGFYGKSPSEWLRSTFLRQLAGHDRSQKVYISSAPLKIIFPSSRSVKEGYLEEESAFCLANRIEFSNIQRWLPTYLHHWKADQLGRSRAMPHDKMYCRMSPCLKKIAWYLLTSSNLSRAAWGTPHRFEDQKMFSKNYEAGVMFFPKFFEEEYFKIDGGGENGPVFPFKPDLPLTEYRKGDYPFVSSSE